MLKISNLDLKHGNHPVLNQVNLEIDTCLITALIAPSGSGKTTLFNALLGLHNYKNGEIYYNDQKLDNISFYQNISFMPQTNGLYEYLSGKQNLKFFTKLADIKLSKSQIDQLFTDYDLEEFINVKVSKYSGGMKKKLSLMITLAQDCDYIFLDEPTVGIDPVQKLEFWSRLKALKLKNKTIIVSTHVMDEVSHCDQVIFLRDTKVIANDTPQNLLTNLNVTNLNDAFIKLAKEQNE